MRDHGNCPNCNADLNSGSIWETGLAFAQEGGHYGQNGIPAATLEEAEELADKYAKAYGATRTEGQWGRKVGIYDRPKDRTVLWKCPDCDHEWPSL